MRGPARAEDEDLLPELEPIAATVPVRGARAAAAAGSAAPGRLSEAALAHLTGLLQARPGPGGLGAPEQRASGVEVGRPTEVPLNARALELGPSGAKVTAATIRVADAIGSALATWADRPVWLLGAPGSGKTHALNGLAAALAAAHLGSAVAAPRGAFEGVVRGLKTEQGSPLPIRVDMSSVATLSISSGEALLEALARQREIPEDLLGQRGPAVLIADRIDVAVELGAPGFDPAALLRDVQRVRPGWRVVAAGRSPLRGYLEQAAGAGQSPLPLIEVVPLDPESVRAFVMGWAGVARPAPPDPRGLADRIPLEMRNPRLLQLLLGQWVTVSTGFEKASKSKRASEVCRLILDGACMRAEIQSGTVNARQDLRVLADTLSALPSGAMMLEDVQRLSREGFMRDSVESLETTGLIEVRLARGERPVGAVAFTHPLFHEVLLAEYVVQELTSLGLRKELDILAVDSDGVQAVAPYTPGAVQRIVEMADAQAAQLVEHLRDDLLEASGTWLWYQLNGRQFPNNPYYPRLLAVLWILAGTLNRHGQAHREAFDQLATHCGTTMLDLLAAAGEDALSQAVAKLT